MSLLAYKFPLIGYEASKSHNKEILSKQLCDKDGYVIYNNSKYDPSKYKLDYISTINNKYYTMYMKYDPKTSPHSDFCIKKQYTLSYLNEIQNNVISATNMLKKINTTTIYTDFIKTISINENKKKILMMGDIHGSYHTFYRHLLRLHKIDVIDINTMTINKDFIIVLLGDVVDRGGFSIDILNILCMLISHNPHNIIYNRGNHETTEISILYGLYKEIKNKICGNLFDGKKLYKHIIKLFEQCPSAVIIKTNNNNYFWLCHGCVPYITSTYISVGNDKILIKNVGHFIKVILSFNNVNIGIDEVIANQIRWNDPVKTPYTTNSNKTQLNLARSGNDLTQHIYYIDTKLIDTYLLYFNFIIRGHNDNVDNFLIFNKNNLSIDDIDSKYITKTNNTHGPIFKMSINRWTHNNMKRLMTISTNTGYNRPLTSDSFLLLQFNNFTFESKNKINSEWLNL